LKQQKAIEKEGRIGLELEFQVQVRSMLSRLWHDDDDDDAICAREASMGSKRGMF
jgi:hypothetical protein